MFKIAGTLVYKSKSNLQNMLLILIICGIVHCIKLCKIEFVRGRHFLLGASVI